MNPTSSTIALPSLSSSAPLTPLTSVASVQSADRDTLLASWKDRFQCDAPARVHTGLMRSVLAWHVQCESHGLKPLAPPLPPPLAPAPSAPSAPQTPAASGAPSNTPLRPGARLLREWRGATHEVRVGPHGFEYAGTTYKSLSAIARAITGTPWSGPAFFGLKR